MRAARIDHSKRLQRVDRLLSTGQKFTTLDIVTQANVCAVNSAVAELRANGRDIKCWREGDVWFYQMPERRNYQPPHMPDWEAKRNFAPKREKGEG